MRRLNNEQIDNTDYYRLPCGKYLEDYIHARGLAFALGSAVKYMWRAGKKDGESREKDLKKAGHYIDFASRNLDWPLTDVRSFVVSLVDEARTWDGYTLRSALYEH